ncbi:hypothetical protein F4679DRAFT_565421 [Xylaria curta]|nr:hypothetical protein F4679DRAFT_565421 [Xylaria curta]
MPQLSELASQVPRILNEHSKRRRDTPALDLSQFFDFSAFWRECEPPTSLAGESSASKKTKRSPRRKRAVKHRTDQLSSSTEDETSTSKTNRPPRRKRAVKLKQGQPFRPETRNRPLASSAIIRDTTISRKPNAGVQISRGCSLSDVKNGIRAPEWHVIGEINGCPIDALADTGANVNAISKDEADRTGILPQPGTAGKTIRLPSGKICLSLGTADLSFSFDGEHAAHSLRCNIVERLEYGMVLCYDFLRKTETLTRFFKDRIKEVTKSGMKRFSLCLLDDSAVPNIMRARMNGFINGSLANVVPDTGSDIMAISASCVRRLGLEVDITRKTQVTFADGSSATTLGIVTAAWNFIPLSPQNELYSCLDDGGHATSADGRKRRVSDIESDDEDDWWEYEWEYEWHVIEDLPVDAILSLDFIKTHDVFARHQHAFSHIPCPMPAELFGICELPGGNEGIRSVVEEFILDLNSADPFTYEMVVRESARQSEIKRTILDFPSPIQETQRVVEEKRIDFWNRIKNAKERGEDWVHLRDEYITGLGLQSAQLPRPQNPNPPPSTASRTGATRTRAFWRRSRNQ